MSLNERVCTVLLSYETTLVKESDYQEKLESKDDNSKIEALRAIIAGLLLGETFPKLLMSVIKFCLHSENHTVKKLLLLYWEVVEKKNKDGVLLHEMILVCNAMKNNLTHPNEYIRGSTLRFLCKIKEAEILESLVPSITDNLSHRHSYVRKNAVMTVYSVYEAHAELIPDAPELIEQFLYSETNPAAKRNAFLMLFHCSPEKAQTYLASVLGTIGGMGESFQLVALELIRKLCRANPALRGQYIRAIFLMINSTSASVAYEGANTLVSLSSAPTAVRQAVNAYTQLLTKESDNNIKLVILNRLASLKRKNDKILQELLMDILRTLASPNQEIRRKTLELAMDLLTPRNVEDVVQLLKKELVRADSPEQQQGIGGRNEAYRKLLVDAMHACAVKFPDVVGTVVHLLITYLGDENAASALDVVYFVREIAEEYPLLRDAILSKVLESFDEIRSSDVYRVTLWIIGEYALEASILQAALSTLRTSVGPLPLLQTALNTLAAEEEKRQPEEKQQIPAVAVASQSSPSPEKEKFKQKAPTVLPDGTYASQSAASTAVDTTLTTARYSSDPRAPSLTHLRLFLLNGDFFLGACLANTVTKLVLRFVAFSGYGTAESNHEIAQALMLFVSILRVGSVAGAVKTVDPDGFQRITLCMKALLDPEIGSTVFSTASRQVFSNMLKEVRKKEPKNAKVVELVKQADDLITIRQLKGKLAQDEDLVDDDETDLTKALGSKSQVAKDIESKLNRVYQLTGFSDPVYAEAHLTVQSYDIVLDLLIVNQTNIILQNVQVELHTSGDLRVVERPPTQNLPPYAVVRLQATIKLTSTESGVIFGNIVYDNASGTNKTVIVLSNIHMDIQDYISPAFTSDPQFRAMWAEFEWENKVAINTEMTDLNGYLQHVINITNMQCLTPPSTLKGEANFLAANLYARSMFNEDALLNLSVEKQKNGKIGGYIRIRSKTQGIALSLGDKITAKQKGSKA